MDPLRIAIVDPLGPAGRSLRRHLDEAGPSAALSLFGSEAEAGTLTEFQGEVVVARAFTAEALREQQLVFLCGDAARAQEVSGLLKGSRACLGDLGGSLPVAGGVRVWLPGAGSTIGPGERQFRLPHAASALLAPVVGAIAGAAEILRLEATFFEPVALSGDAGIDELHKQTVEVLSFRPPPIEALGSRIAFNLVPAAGPAELAAGRRVREELESLIASDLPALSLVVLRAPVFLGIAAELSIELDGDLDDRDAAAILEEAPGVELSADREVAPGDLPDQGTSSPVWVRIHAGCSGGRIRLWLVADGLLHGELAAALELANQVSVAAAG